MVLLATVGFRIHEIDRPGIRGGGGGADNVQPSNTVTHMIPFGSFDVFDTEGTRKLFSITWCWYNGILRRLFVFGIDIIAFSGEFFLLFGYEGETRIKV